MKNITFRLLVKRTKKHYKNILQKFSRFTKKKYFPALMTILSFMVLIQWTLKPLDILFYKFFNPGETSFMAIRKSQAEVKNAKYKLRYRFVPVSRISGYLQKTAIAAEDGNFYTHCGVDLDAVSQCLMLNIRKKKFVKGASTITQQLAKNLFLSPEKSIGRKVREAIIAIEMEMILSKSRILELYLNVAEWGNGIFGAEAAARYYYGKPASGLTLQEAVSLVSVLPSPIRHSPVRKDKFTNLRVNWVWQQVAALGMRSRH